MSRSLMEIWLGLKQERALRAARLYCASTTVVGAIALVPNFFIAFLVAKFLLAIAGPTPAESNVFATILAGLLTALLFWDCLRAERDDMGIIPLWVAREYFHFGPRVLLDVINEWRHVRQFARVNVPACAQVLAYLATKNTPTRREEFLRVFPGLTWEEMVPQLRVIEGVMIFRNGQSVSLLTPLRLELRGLFGHQAQAEFPQDEPEAFPAAEPHQADAREILGVTARSTRAEIKAAYRRRIKECHPDRFANADAHTRAQAEEWTKTLNAAYVELLGK